MSDSTDLVADQYLSEWDPKSYLRQFYSTDFVPDDSRAVLSFLVEQLNQRNVFGGRALEFGCGPTIWCALPLASRMDEIYLADYLPSNLEEVRRWIDDSADAHDWSIYIRHVLQLEGISQPTEADLSHRSQMLRSRIASLCLSDANQSPCLRRPMPPFELVTSFFCLECIHHERLEWQKYMRRLTEQVAPGGHLILSSILHSQKYVVEDRQFPVTPLIESDFADVLIDCGLRPESLVIRSVLIEDWKAEGFDTICLIAGSK